jgi:hypothetical protein
MNRQGFRDLGLLYILRKNTAITREGAEENWETLLYSVTRQGLDLDASQIHISVVNSLLSLLQLRRTFLV